MRTIIIEKGGRVQPAQYRGQLGIDKVIIHEGAIIGEYAFRCCTGITEVNIAEGVTIGEYAFSDCTGITEVDIAEGVTIGKHAFWYCTGITELNIAKRVKIGWGGFQNCKGITEVNIAQGVNIDKFAFYDCTGITEVNIAKGVVIGDNAFFDCTGITNLSIAEGVIVQESPIQNAISQLYPSGLFPGTTQLNIAERLLFGHSLSKKLVRFSMVDPIVYFYHQLVSRLSELVQTLRKKGHEEFNLQFTSGGLVAHQGVNSLQSLCVKTILRSDHIKDLSMVKSIIRSQKLLASEEIMKYRCFISEGKDRCTGSQRG